MMRAVDLRYPFTGRWQARNSPADRVPSHGTTLFGSARAIDFVPVDESGRTAPVRLGTLLRPEPPDRFPGFGRPILAPLAGTVMAAHDTEPDHPARRGLPSVGYALTQRRRLAAGWRALAGNHLLIEADQVVIALCHLRQGSIEVELGQRVSPGDRLGRCGNSGNSTEPHVHLQAVDTRDIDRAGPVPVTFEGRLPRSGEIIDVLPRAR